MGRCSMNSTSRLAPPPQPMRLKKLLVQGTLQAFFVFLLGSFREQSYMREGDGHFSLWHLIRLAMCLSMELACTISYIKHGLPDIMYRTSSKENMGMNPWSISLIYSKKPYGKNFSRWISSVQTGCGRQTREHLLTKNTRSFTTALKPTG
ncbi:uncharacterized protein BYT42DRAFT_111741 [Radiomyces spectabilis]|uniref:uncharacterized protein n=1 Tax=Radiomyces spectabilis TaxID=64574 RepID=UPI00221FEE0C|nr:uncharacterized protein BYT42DRAFT_111741 [Radiomyces spectabilis]KAI8369476.1 hypothetical protein BYT42DRAFT_111741 [Radiomyces spectabilis]